MPAAEGICTGEVIRILDSHVDMGVPEVTRDPCAWACTPIPGGILSIDRCRIHEGPVLDDQGNTKAEVVRREDFRVCLAIGQGRGGRRLLTPVTLVPLIMSVSTASVITYPPASPAYTLRRVMPMEWSW